MKTNPWEEAARTKKVLAILSRIPSGATLAKVEATADWLEGLCQEDRDALAAAAGVKPPSPETWDRVVEAARSRVATSAAFGRVPRSAARR